MSQVPVLDRAVRRAFSALCWKVATPVAYRAVKALDRDDWVALTTLKVEVAGYRCPQTLSGDLQIAAFFKKYPGFDLGIDLKAKAIETFWASERQCFQANEKLSPLIHDIQYHGEGVRQFITDVRKEVGRVLGRCPRVIDLELKFGPGSTFSDVGAYTTVPDKMSESYTMTTRARAVMHAWDETAWARYACAGLSLNTSFHFCGGTDLDQNPYSTAGECVVPGLVQVPEHTCWSPRTETIVRGNRFTTVPKDAWKLRGICIEPSINLAYQLGVGSWISKRMNLAWGWTKTSQQQFHRLLARIGSLTGGLATIDLSNASDTVCTNLVKLLLPKDWFKLLDMLRSPYTRVEDRWVKIEKFSSMGNGFTFELETLIFRAITNVVSRRSKNDGQFHSLTVSTFGDDIICPKDVAGDVIAALKFFGFQVNEAKTFIDGGFRESCGGDYFKGLDVRPHYLKNDVTEPHHYIALANGLRRFGIRHILCGGPDLYRIPRLRILDALPHKIRKCTGPEALGDIVVWDDESTWNYVERSSIRYFRAWRPVVFGRTQWTHFRPGVVLASALYGCGDGRTQPIGHREVSIVNAGGVLTRKNGSYVSGYRFGHVAYS